MVPESNSSLTRQKHLALKKKAQGRRDTAGAAQRAHAKDRPRTFAARTWPTKLSASLLQKRSGLLPSSASARQMRSMSPCTAPHWRLSALLYCSSRRDGIILPCFCSSMLAWRGMAWRGLQRVRRVVSTASLIVQRHLYVSGKKQNVGLGSLKAPYGSHSPPR